MKTQSLPVYQVQEINLQQVMDHNDAISEYVKYFEPVHEILGYYENEVIDSILSWYYQ